MTGPARPFEGVQGFFEAVAPITLEALGKPVGGLMGLQRVFTKAIPACGHSMAQVEAVMRLRDRIPPDAIAELDIGTYRVAWMAIGGGAGDAAEKWDPKSRETADHSLPYLVAIALFHGSVALDSFDEDKISDERLRPLMRRITVHVDDDMERRFVEDRVMASRISVQLKDGTRVEDIATTSRGKPDMPMSDEDFSLKFMDMAPMVMPPGLAEHLLGRLWTIHDLSDISDLTGLYRQWSLQIGSGSQGSCG
jgi:2-methylcitrate dehydratase